MGVCTSLTRQLVPMGSLDDLTMRVWPVPVSVWVCSVGWPQQHHVPLHPLSTQALPQAGSTVSRLQS